MRLVKIPVLGVQITLNNAEEILEQVKTYLQKKAESKPLIIFTPNPEQIVAAQTDIKFGKILNSADIALPDGEGIIFVSQILKSKIPSTRGIRLSSAEVLRTGKNQK